MMTKILEALCWVFAALALVYFTACVSFFAENDYTEAAKGLVLTLVCVGGMLLFDSLTEIFNPSKTNQTPR